jgi:ribosomal protein L1
MKQVTYGLGGYDPSKPNNNIVEEIDLPDEETNETI